MKLDLWKNSESKKMCFLKEHRGTQLNTLQIFDKLTLKTETVDILPQA